MTPRIVLIGAGSSVFGYNSVLDASNIEALCRANLILYDIDEAKLEKMGSLAERIVEVTGSGIEVEWTADREDALADADFVVLSIAVDRMNRWRMDWEIPFNLGIKQVIGENGGPGGLFHTMRNIPPVLAICSDMEDCCPDALLLNYTNPVPRLCLAIDRYTDIKVVGLCHEVEGQLERLSKIIGVPKSLLDGVSAGLNHFSWFKHLRLTNGDDAYPLLDDALEKTPGFQPLCRALYNKFGLYPSTDDNHAGEYLAYAWQACPDEARGFNWIDRMEEHGERNWRKINGIIKGDEPLDVKGRFSGERMMHIIGGIVSNSRHTELQANLPNDGQIPNLLDGAIVETPAFVDSSGINPIGVGELPEGLAALCNIQTLVTDLVVEAGVHGDNDLALQAILADPVVHDLEAGKKAFKALMEAHADLLPQFTDAA
ncbi:alpha-glucosidase/alpha-galactosidase [Candidatus Bathyarchaeota archaeon]|nr:alpha-glucosidase/alpha-galactosidase [Candidatus Bathyarchaeota archaeon]MBL7078859.1 alpha-glucosidase/alpha-galactosidase [Candidatus Bathyarchaeota archaeon]